MQRPLGVSSHQPQPATPVQLFLVAHAQSPGAQPTGQAWGRPRPSAWPMGLHGSEAEGVYSSGLRLQLHMAYAPSPNESVAVAVAAAAGGTPPGVPPLALRTEAEATPSEASMSMPSPKPTKALDVAIRWPRLDTGPLGSCAPCACRRNCTTE